TLPTEPSVSPVFLSPLSPTLGDRENQVSLRKRVSQTEWFDQLLFSLTLERNIAMNRTLLKANLFAILAALGLSLFALTGLVQADTHHSGHAKIQGKGNGKHHLHSTAHGHVAHAHVQNGKVQGVSVSHKG